MMKQTNQEGLNKMQHLSEKIKNIITRDNMQLIDSCEELRYCGKIQYIYFLFHPERKEFFRVSSDFDVFYHTDLSGIENDKIRAENNNLYVVKEIAKDKIVSDENDKIAAFLNDCFGDTLPARKAKHVIQKYLHRNTLLEYANGKKGVEGLKAYSARLFTTKAYDQFCDFVAA